MSKFIYAFGIILFGLLLGYAIQILVKRELIKLPIHINGLRKLLQRVALPSSLQLPSPVRSGGIRFGYDFFQHAGSVHGLDSNIDLRSGSGSGQFMLVFYNCFATFRSPLSAFYHGSDLNMHNPNQ
jgi:hypothetical protein